MNQVWAGVAVAAAVVASTIMFGDRADGQQVGGVGPEQFDVAEVDQLRADLVDVSSIYFELGTIFQNENIMSAASEALISFESMSDDQLSNFAHMGPKTAELRAAVAHLRDMIITGVTRQMAAANSPDFPEAPYTNLCGSIRSDTNIFFAARLVYEVAQGVWAALSRACDQIGVVGGFGANTSLLCIPVDLILFAARVTLDEIANCDGNIDSAEILGTYERVGHIHGDVEVVQDTADSIESKVDILDGKIDMMLDMIEDLRLANCDIIRLLHTPQGQRESSLPVCDDHAEFPYNWPE